MHVGTVLVDGAKMAKSAGNLVLVEDLLRAHRAAALRLLLLDRRWDEAWEWRPSDLAAAEARLDALYAAAGRSGGGHDDEHDVLAALLTDLDVPAALALAIDRGGVAARTAVTVLALG
jgi:cysteinyl-tRNA synthetase